MTDQTCPGNVMDEDVMVRMNPHVCPGITSNEVRHT